MAVLARSSITLVTSVDIDSVYWFYILQASTAAAPAKPTTVPATKGNAPSGWTTAEPTTVDINKTLYRVELTYFTDGTGVYSSVNQVSSYEAAKVAYNKADTVQTNLDTIQSQYGYRFKKDIVIKGSSTSTYYPVYFAFGDQNVPREVMITRGYSEQAPSDWNTSTHKGSLVLRIKANYGGWGGATYKLEILDFSEMYSTMFADAYVGTISGYGLTVYLRGGGSTGAIYHVYSDQKIEYTASENSWHATMPYIGLTQGTQFGWNGGSESSPTYKWTVDAPKTSVNTTRIKSLMALETATTAQTTANSAQTTANTANSNASTALSTANTANSNASTALSTANAAKTTAENAESRVRFKGAIKANNASGYGAITAGNIIVGTSAGYHHLKLGKQFDINYPILYCGTNIASGGTKDDNYTVYPVTITTTQNLTLTPYKAVYIKGTLAGSLFTPASTTPLTQTEPEPTSASDTNYYMRLGLAYDSTHMYLEADHPIYRWSAGAFRLFGSSADEIVRAWCKDTTVTTIGGMEINGAHIATKSIEADSINVNSLEAIVAKIGNWSIGGKTDSAPSSGAETKGSIYTGSFGSDGSIYLIPSGTTTSKSIGGSDPPRTDWRITAGSSFGVTSDGSLYASNAYLSNATISGTVTATYGKIGKWNIVNNLETVQIAAGAPEGSLYYKKAGTTDSIVLVAGGTLPRNVTIAGYSRNDWKIMVSNAFGVKANGDLVANNAIFKESVYAYGGLAAELLSTTGTLKDQISNSDISVYSWDHFVFFSGDGISVANFSTYIQTWCNGSSSGRSGDWRIKDGWRPMKNVWFPFIYSHNGFRMGCMQIRTDGYINAYIYPTYGSGATNMKTEYRNNNTTNITGSDNLFFNASWMRA